MTDALFGALLFVAALVPRVAAALVWAGEPVWDGHYYDFGARRIAAGFGYSDDRDVGGALVWHPWCHYPVGYSGLLAAFYRVLGPSHAVAGVVDAITGAALAVVTWALARRALSERRARFAGLLVAFHPGMILYAALVMTEPLAALLTLVAFWLAVRDDRPRRGLAAGALTLGVAALVRPQALLCAPFLGVIVLERETGLLRGGWPRWRARGLAALVACGLALLPVLPWTARNCAVMDGCALVSTNGGWNLAIGAFPRATGRFETLRSSDGCREVTGQVQQDRCWFRYGVQQIADHPIHWLALVPAKLGFTFDHESFAVQYLHEARPDVWPDATRERARETTTLAHRMLLVAAALGGVAFPVARRRRLTRAAATQGALFALVVALLVTGLAADSPSFWALAVVAAVVPWLPLPGRPETRPALSLGLSLLATTLFTHAVFFGEDRYHVVVTPVLAILAAAALRPVASPSSRAAFRPS
ncbi:MAG TPA: glycosyltransferase family 39 protein [Polyangiaceae bacterium]|nr:glycosyltransferase family 39 protein [Polyangiaceae bacterium]